ncbi:MAG: nuclease-related domain-containing protein, partial [Lysinibacillus sp.]
MLMKPFESSLMATGLRALVHRLNANHQIHAKMLLELQQMEAGDNGEQYLVKQLQKLAYTMNIHILHNVNLQVPVPIQLDVVIVTPYDVII